MTMTLARTALGHLLNLTCRLIPMRHTTSAASATSCVENDPAAVQPHAVAGSPLGFVDWARPAIMDVLADHQPFDGAGGIVCAPEDADFETPYSVDHVRHFTHWEDWRDHVGDLIAQRLESAIPTPTYDDVSLAGIEFAAGTLPQHTKRATVCKHCQQPIERDATNSIWVHSLPGPRWRVICAPIPGEPITYATPE